MVIGFDLDGDGILDPIEKAAAQTYLHSLAEGDYFGDDMSDDDDDFLFDDGDDDYTISAAEDW